MTEYVLSAVIYNEEVLLIEKVKPEWQLGKYNLPGGKIEPSDDSPEHAARRELREETDLFAEQSVKVGTLKGDDWLVHVVKCRVWENEVHRLTNERPFFLPAWQAIQHPSLIPNLKLIIPLVYFNVTGWTITEYGNNLTVHLGT